MKKLKLNSLFLKVAPVFFVVLLQTTPATSTNDIHPLTDVDKWNFLLQTQELDYIVAFMDAFKTGLNKKEEDRLASAILDISQSYNMDPLFVLALIKTESTFNNWARSKKGAIGMMQILPSTGREVALKLGLKWQGEKTLFDPSTNVRIGIHYLSRLIGRFSDDVEIATVAYNLGPTDLKRRIRLGKNINFRYVDTVNSNYDSLRENIHYN